MKLSAIAGRGSKKDFFDLYFLLKEFSFDFMLGLFRQKFVDINVFHMVKSLNFFDDADLEPDPNLLEKISWEEVKKEIGTQIKVAFR